MPPETMSWSPATKAPRAPSSLPSLGSPGLPPERPFQPFRRNPEPVEWGEAGFADRSACGAQAESAKLDHLSAETLARVEAIKANLRGLGYSG